MKLFLRTRLGQLWNQDERPQFCLRCPNVELSILPESVRGVAFLECPVCGRHYTNRKGRSVADRWLSPISLATYPVLFEKEPVESAERVAAQFRKQYSERQICIMIEDIEDELSHPKQMVNEILDTKSDERQLREFLKHLALELRETDRVEALLVVQF